jgi:hypothetical protein
MRKPAAAGSIMIGIVGKGKKKTRCFPRQSSGQAYLVLRVAYPSALLRKGQSQLPPQLSAKAEAGAKSG